MRSIYVILLALLLAAPAGAGSHEALQLIDRLQERVSQCHDYQYLVQSFERKGEKKEERSYRLFAKDEKLVRIKVVGGRGKGSEATLLGRVKAYNGISPVCAYAIGFGELGPLPRFVAAQAENRAGTAASAIRIVEPAHEAEAQRALADSAGAAPSIPDEAILDAWRVLAREEGLFCEPSSAAGLAALLADPPRGARVVCVITGHGLKDPDAVA